MVYAQPRSKDVVIDVMDYCQRVAVMKQMPQIQQVSEQAIYKFVEELLLSDRNRWSRLIGLLGGFHKELTYLNATGKKLFWWWD